MDNNSYYIRVPKRWARMTMIVGITALFAAPLRAVASHVFNDVPSGHTFHNDISWLADAGVTKGCNLPNNDEFCLEDNVTRGQMGAFMRPFAQYIDAEDGTPAQADNASSLDGQNGSDFETRVAAASCGVTVDPSTMDGETSCLPSTGGQIGTETNAELLSVTINAPTAGS